MINELMIMLQGFRDVSDAFGLSFFCSRMGTQLSNNRGKIKTNAGTRDLPRSHVVVVFFFVDGDATSQK